MFAGEDLYLRHMAAAEAGEEDEEEEEEASPSAPKRRRTTLDAEKRQRREEVRVGGGRVRGRREDKRGGWKEEAEPPCKVAVGFERGGKVAAQGGRARAEVCGGRGEGRGGLLLLTARFRSPVPEPRSFRFIPCPACSLLHATLPHPCFPSLPLCHVAARLLLGKDGV